MDLGLTDREFYQMTPRRFSSLLRHKEKSEAVKQEHFDFMVAQLTANVVNTGFRSTEKPVKTKDFMPSPHQQKRKSAKPMSPDSGSEQIEMTEERRKAVADAFRSMLIPDRSIWQTP